MLNFYFYQFIIKLIYYVSKSCYVSVFCFVFSINYEIRYIYLIFCYGGSVDWLGYHTWGSQFLPLAQSTITFRLKCVPEQRPGDGIYIPRREDKVTFTKLRLKCRVYLCLMLNNDVLSIYPTNIENGAY